LQHHRHPGVWKSLLWRRGLLNRVLGHSIVSIWFMSLKLSFLISQRSWPVHGVNRTMKRSNVCKVCTTKVSHPVNTNSSLLTF
jgi:hypothetical protein